MPGILRPGATMVVGALAVMLAVAWQWGPEPPAPQAVRLAAEDWRLPAQAVPQAEKAAEMLSRAGLWGRLPEAAAQEPPGEPPWRILGLLARGSERYVMIKIEGQPEQQLAVGDVLPGGSKILEIRDGGLCLLVNGQKRLLPLYRQARQVW